ncbi:MAG: YkvA family protein [Acinetobacter sp.]
MYQQIKQWAKTLKKDIVVVWLVAKDQRTPVWIKILALIIAAYALSPIDLIPDFIPVLGYLDDIIIVPLGLLLVIKLTPKEIIEDCRIRASLLAERPVNRWAAGVIILIWLLFLGYLALYFINMQKL